MGFYLHALWVAGAVVLAGCGGTPEPVTTTAPASNIAVTAAAPALPASQPACRPDSLLSGTSATDVHLSADRLQVPPGTVALTVRNESPALIGFNLCFSQLQRIENGVPVCAQAYMPANTGCPAILLTLASGEIAADALDLVPGVPAGMYRFVTEIERIASGTLGERVLVETELFTIGE